MIHNVWPAFERSNNEKSHHGLKYIIEVGVVSNPVPPLLRANKLVSVRVLADIAVMKMAFIGVYCEYGEHEPEDEDNDYDVCDRTTSVKKRCHDHPQLWIV